MLKTYKVTLISKDNQKYQIIVQCSSDDDAIMLAFENIKKHCWEEYEYKLQNLERLE